MNQLTSDPDYLKLLRSHNTPNLETVVVLAKRYGMDDARQLWALFDYICQQWAFERSNEAS